MRNRYAEPLQQVERTYVLWRGRKLSYFAGCDYLRLSSHPDVLSAVRTCLDEFGLNVAASRITTGNHRIYGELESAVRKFFKAEAVIVSSTGYFTNIIAAQGLRGAVDHVLMDERAHGSLRDAATVLGCRVTEFRHRDPGHLRKCITHRTDRSRVAVLTDGVFSHNGSMAPLAEYRGVAGSKALLWVDDAHAAGVFGKHGRGAVEACGVGGRNVLQTITFSKAFGSYGGAILTHTQLAERIAEQSPAVAGNTPIPLPLACATMEALKLCRAELRERLLENILRFWKFYSGEVPAQLSPIVAFGSRSPAALCKKLLAAGIYPPLIKYPGGPKEGYFRFAIASEHSTEQIAKLAEVLAASKSEIL